MKHYILPTLAVLLGLSACSSDIDTTDGGATKVPVTVNASIGSPFTRSTPLGDDAKQSSFNQGDEISVSNDEETKVYRLDTDGTWTTDGEAIGANPLTYTTFEAYYPIKEGNSYENGTVETNQNETDLTLSDFMTASKSLNPTKDNTLNLSFQRKTAKVTINIVGYKNEVAEDDRQIRSIMVDANINVGDKAKKNIRQITMKEVEGSETQQFVALVGPTSPTDVVEVYYVKQFLTLFFKNRPALHVYTKPNLEAGKAYTFDVTVGRDVLTVESVTVTGFTDDDESDGGKAKSHININLVDLGTQSLGDYLTAQKISDGSTIKFSGAWNRDYFSQLNNYLKNHSDIELDLTQVKGMTSVNRKAFNNCAGLTGIILPSGVKGISEDAFNGSSLKSIYLPEGIISIGYRAFGGTSIESLTLPITYTNVGENVFAGMSSLTEIRFKGDMDSFGLLAFEGDSNLRTIYLENCTKVPQLAKNALDYLDKGTTVYVMNENMLAKFNADNNWNSHGFNFEVAK